MFPSSALCPARSPPPPWFMNVPILCNKGWEGAGLSVLNRAQAQQWTNCAAISTFIPLCLPAGPSPPTIPAPFCCFYHFHHWPISSRKSCAWHSLRTVTSGFSDVSQSLHYHSNFSCARQVFRCRSGIEPPALFRAVHSEPIF